ncbi:MAG: beta-lactamase family protein [Verrucomicrobia bacterium]|nr:beta-lactamase family protein [Verrucomicrobiota bacterium]MBV9644641.1 beta-lactamase family protein [Verrucomicrobiota bacterium]
MPRPTLYLLLLLNMAILCQASTGDLSITSLRVAADYSVERRGFSFLVEQDGRITYESYANGDSIDRIASIFSGTKGFWCVAAAAAMQDGILDFDEPVRNIITEWRSDPNKSDIRVRDLLNFTAGIEPGFSLHGRSIGDRNLYSLRLPAARPRGESFIYGPSQLQIYSEVLRRKLLPRHLTPEEYLYQRILRPLGISGVNFREDRKGNPLLASGFRLTARQWARLGEMILGKGKYHGHQLVRSDLLAECFRGTHINPMFGMGFWLNRVGPESHEIDVEKMLDIPWQRQNWRDGCLCREAPRDMIAAIGSGYQRMFIVPSMNLVIVRQGQNDSRFSDAHFLRLIFGG